VLTRLDLRGLRGAELVERLPRPAVASDEAIDEVRAILSEVRAGGDAAVRACTERFDGVAVDALAVPRERWDAALQEIGADLRKALEAAYESILACQQAEAAPDQRFERDGLVVRSLRRPVDRAGLYVPSAAAPLISTVLMTALPARAAGVPQVALCTAPGRDGSVAPGILAAAAIAGVDEVYRVGGVQAIAAMAYGTESIRPVDVIVGPGSARVALAKREVAGEGRVGVPSAFAGPSEVVVVADAGAATACVAIDIVVQAEHGPNGLAWLVTWSDEVADAVTDEVGRIVAAAPRRDEITSTLADGGYAVVVDGPAEAIEVANAIAPEHLELLVDDPEALVPLVRHAGAVFLGQWAPASIGDYVAGPSHVLPTAGSARYSGALTADDFTKPVHVVSLDRAAFDRLGPHVVAIADAEGLPAHADSIRARG
jgi:histidinol dehydrogenase